MVLTCNDCHQVLPAEMFGADRSKANGKRSRCRLCVSKRSAAWRARRPEEQRRAYQAAWRAANADRLTRYERERYEREGHRALARARRTALAAPERRRLYEANRRARKVAAEGRLSHAAWEEILEQAGRRCLACGMTDDLTVDHVVPLILGGRGDAANIQPLCRSCNSRKKIKTTDFRPSTWTLPVSA